MEGASRDAIILYQNHPRCLNTQRRPLRSYLLVVSSPRRTSTPKLGAAIKREHCDSGPKPLKMTTRSTNVSRRELKILFQLYPKHPEVSPLEKLLVLTNEIRSEHLASHMVESLPNSRQRRLKTSNRTKYTCFKSTKSRGITRMPSSSQPFWAQAAMRGTRWFVARE